MRLPGGRSRTALRRDRSRDCSRRARARSQAVTIVVAEPASADSAAVTGIAPTRNSLVFRPAAHRCMALILYVRPPTMIGKHRAACLAWQGQLYERMIAGETGEPGCTGTPVDDHAAGAGCYHHNVRGSSLM
jgi:hypothetical protein